MEEWTSEQFNREVEKNKGLKNLNNNSDASIRQARFFQVKYAYEMVSEEEREKSLFKFKSTVLSAEKFTFFWETKSPFSQWHKCLFETNIGNEITSRNISANQTFKFTSAEQCMMYSKAMLFLDNDIAEKILVINDVKRIKQLGRKVNFFDHDVWDFNRNSIVYEVNKAKFTQNEELKEALFFTKGSTLVEAAPNDTIWGIGLTADDPRALKRNTWLGKNLLGEILTQLRTDLMGEY
jgi:ribA/ribD-fused uncharacterized protein